MHTLTLTASMIPAPLRRLKACQLRYSSTLAWRRISDGYQWSGSLYLLIMYFRMAGLEICQGKVACMMLHATCRFYLQTIPLTATTISLIVIIPF